MIKTIKHWFKSHFNTEPELDEVPDKGSVNGH